MTRAHGIYSKDAYAPYGEPYNETATTDRSFTGQDSDLTQNQGMYDFQFRKLDTTAGRWLSPDPSGWNAVDLTNPQTLNRYAYAGNSPLTNVDPDGLDYTVCGYGGGGTICPTYSDPAWANWEQQIVQSGVGLPPPGTSGPIYCPGVGICEYIIYTASGIQYLYNGPGPGGIVGGRGGAGSAPPPVQPAPNKGQKPDPKVCGGTFEYVGIEGDGGEVGAFSGVIHEHDSIDGNSVGHLGEVWIGGEGPLIGAGKITSYSDKSIMQGFLGFVGVGINTGPLAGAQVGYAAGKGWGGLYIEGHLGIWGFGGGSYLRTSCKKGG